MASEREKMAAGEWYCCLDPELDALRVKARSAVHTHNTMPPAERGAMAPHLRALFGAALDAFLEAPFHCAYGFNVFLGQGVYLNAGCTILDTAPVRIGARSMLGPGVQLYCADHHRDPVLRAQGLEIARPISIGSDVWLGGGAIVLGGITIGDRAIVGAGSVVTRDVQPGATVAGNPARLITPRD
jgi:maltose O-acetyltransferase